MAALEPPRAAQGSSAAWEAPLRPAGRRKAARCPDSRGPCRATRPRHSSRRSRPLTWHTRARLQLACVARHEAKHALTSRPGARLQPAGTGAAMLCHTSPCFAAHSCAAGPWLRRGGAASRFYKRTQRGAALARRRRRGGAAGCLADDEMLGALRLGAGRAACSLAAGASASSMNSRWTRLRLAWCTPPALSAGAHGLAAGRARRGPKPGGAHAGARGKVRLRAAIPGGSGMRTARALAGERGRARLQRASLRLSRRAVA